MEVSAIFSESSESDYHSTKMRLVFSAEAAGWPEDTDTFKVSQSVICLFVKMDGGNGFCDCSNCVPASMYPLSIDLDDPGVTFGKFVGLFWFPYSLVHCSLVSLFTGGRRSTAALSGRTLRKRSDSRSRDDRISQRTVDCLTSWVLLFAAR